MIDGKEYSKQMRENAVIDNNGNIIVSEELWQQIANIVEKQQAEIDRLIAENIMVVDVKLDENEIREQLEKIKTQKIICIDNTESIKAEAIKEFAEKLKDVFVTIDGTFECWEIEEHIDNLAKEMVGADNERT